MWVFLATEVLFFGGLFMAYVLYRTWYPDAWLAASGHLDIGLGAFNTAVLIGSSLTMALAVNAAQLGNRNAQVIFILLTLVLGFGFLGVKAVEYAASSSTTWCPACTSASTSRRSRGRRRSSSRCTSR